MITFDGQAFMDGIAERIDANAVRIAQRVVANAERFAPKKTGRLATSISYQYDNATHTISFIVGAPYGIFVEYGTRHMRPRPYLRPALNEAEHKVGGIYGFDTEMAFHNVIQTDNQLLARGPYFEDGKGITAAQRKHIKTYLSPTSQGYFRGGKSNVGRAKMSVHHRRQAF